jgi:hypothetical protein
MSHDCGLRIFGELQFLVRTLAHQAEEILAKRLVDLGENVAGGPARPSQRGTHADCLAALPWK